MTHVQPAPEKWSRFISPVYGACVTCMKLFVMINSKPSVVGFVLRVSHSVVWQAITWLLQHRTEDCCAVCTGWGGRQRLCDSSDIAAEVQIHWQSLCSRQSKSCCWAPSSWSYGYWHWGKMLSQMLVWSWAFVLNCLIAFVFVLVLEQPACQPVAMPAV